MKSKISCFNKTIFKKNITKFWPLWLAYLVYMIAAGPINLYQYMAVRYIDESALSRQVTAAAKVFRNLVSPEILFVFAIVAVMATFSYLFSSKNANGMHALPVTRLELFCTNIVSSLGIFFLIDVFTFIVSIFVGISCNVTNPEVFFYALVYQMGITFFAVSFAAFVAMLTGNLLILPIYFFVGNYLYVGIWTVLGYLVERLTFGMVYSWGEKASYVLSPLYYLSEHVSADTRYNQKLSMADAVEINGGGTVAVYAAVGVFLLIAAYRFYRKRQLENAGDVIAVSFMKPIFRIGTGLCGGFAAGIGVAEILFQATSQSDRTFWYILLCSIFFAVIGFFGAEMLMQKSFRVFKKRILAEGLCVFALMVGIAGGLKLDVFGLETALPKKEEIADAYVNMDYPLRFEGEELEELFALHRQIIGEKENIIAAQEDEENTRYTEFRYRLKDGTFFERAYYLPINEENPQNDITVSGKIIALELEAENLSRHLFGDNYRTNRYLSAYIGLYDEYQNYFDRRLDEEEIEVLEEAVWKDMEEGSFGIYQLYSVSGSRSDEFMNEISMTFYNSEKITREEERFYNRIGMENKTESAATAEAVDLFHSNVDTESVYLKFGKKCTNIRKALEELEIVDDTWKLYTYEEFEDLMEIEKEAE